MRLFSEFFFLDENLSSTVAVGKIFVILVKS